jgi:hypothetical protein
MSHKIINLGTEENPKNINLGTCCSKDKNMHIFNRLGNTRMPLSSWTYEDLRNYDTNIIHHVIPLKEYVNTFKKKLGNVHPNLESLIHKELKKLLDAMIIIKVHHFSWVLNLICVRKIYGEIRLYVDFQNLNQAYHKYNYLVPSMEHIL